MANPLQDQLLKAGLVKKHKLKEAARAQERQRDANATHQPRADQVDVQRLQAERAERDRALAAEHKTQARTRELQAQVRQIIEEHKLGAAGDSPYRFTDDGAIRSVLVDETRRRRLASGVLAIVRFEQSYALLPRAAADMVHARGGPVVLDHGQPAASAAVADSADEEHYRQFVVPDDLIW